MRRLYLSLLFLSTTFLYGSAFSQITPIGIFPMQYNPSFAGSIGKSRLVSDLLFHKYNQNSGLGLAFSYDNYLPKIRSGFGIAANIHGSTSDDGYYKTDQQSAIVSFTIAPKISLKGKYSISPSLQVGYQDFSKKYNTSYQHHEDRYSTGLVSTVGILFNATHFYIGYSILIFKTHDLNDIYNDKYSSFLQFGYTFQKNTDSKCSFTPQIVLPIFSSSKYFVYWPGYNLGFRYNNYLLGVFSQFNLFTPTGIQLGWQNKKVRFLVSNDFSLGYQANISMRYFFNPDKKSIHVLDKNH